MLSMSSMRLNVLAAEKEIEYRVQIHDQELAAGTDGVANIEQVFFTTYEKLLSRWGDGSEARTIDIYLFMEDSDESKKGTVAYTTNGAIYV